MIECVCSFEEEYGFLKSETMNIISELVRCKDCKYYLKSDEKCQLIDTRLHFYEANKRWAEDSFCSWAERKEE